MSKVLSPFPFYGGKARMASLICSMLDYENTELYIEPYGGGCRTLLNKKRHAVEMYNDFGYGLVTFMSVMGDCDKTELLIDMLFDEPPTKESFDRMVIQRMKLEDQFGTNTEAELSSLLNNSYKKTMYPLFKVLKTDLRSKRYDRVVECLKEVLKLDMGKFEALEYIQYQHYYKLYSEYWECIKEVYQSEYENMSAEFESGWNLMFSEMDRQKPSIRKAYDIHKEKFARECAVGEVEKMTQDTLNVNGYASELSDVEIAFIIFQLYFSSRDGMGVAWSPNKNADIKSYYRAVGNLRKVSKRMQGVHITQVDSLDLVRQYRKYENVMLYLDPSYLEPEDETKNLGAIYKCSYGYKEHEKLLREICHEDTRARILISNYDVDLYNTYLCDWKKTYYKTFTGVGGKKRNRRLEVLWKNY